MNDALAKIDEKIALYTQMKKDNLIAGNKILAEYEHGRIDAMTMAKKILTERVANLLSDVDQNGDS